MKKIWTVLMYQWGVEDSFTYLLGSWNNVLVAEIEARKEVEGTSGKYDAVVYETNLNSKEKKAICTYRGLGFGDRVNGSAIVYSSVWNRMLDVLKGK